MQKGFCLWFTGLSGAGKSTLSAHVARRLCGVGQRAEVLDGDEMRRHLSNGLGYTREDRDTNVRRIGFVAELLARNGVAAIAAAISPYRDIRAEVRRNIERHGAGFIEIYVECPVEVLVERDVKGLYKKALAGQVPHFTGVSDPYEPPEAAEVVVRTDREPVEDSVARIWGALAARGLVPTRTLA